MKHSDIARQRASDSLSSNHQQHAPAAGAHSSTHVNYSKSKHAKHEGWRSVVTTVLILLAAPLLALLLTVFVFQTYQVDGPSMKNTLQSNDRLIVWKLPRTWARITGNAYIPERSDIVVFTEPKLDEFGQPAGKQLIKRVVALPGERVVIENGVITVFNTEHPNGFRPDASLPPHAIASQTLGTEDITVPENHVFVVGDNRANSLDSRSFGPIHVDNIVGKLTFRILPIDEARHF